MFQHHVMSQCGVWSCTDWHKRQFTETKLHWKAHGGALLLHCQELLLPRYSWGSSQLGLAFTQRHLSEQTAEPMKFWTQNLSLDPAEEEQPVAQLPWVTRSGTKLLYSLGDFPCRCSGFIIRFFRVLVEHMLKHTDMLMERFRSTISFYFQHKEIIKYCAHFSVSFPLLLSQVLRCLICSGVLLRLWLFLWKGKERAGQNLPPLCSNMSSPLASPPLKKDTLPSCFLSRFHMPEILLHFIQVIVLCGFQGFYWLWTTCLGLWTANSVSTLHWNAFHINPRYSCFCCFRASARPLS